MFPREWLLLLLCTVQGRGDEDEEGGLAIPHDSLFRPPPLPLQNGSTSRECFCSYGTEEGYCLPGGVCHRKGGAACFHTIEEVFNEESLRMETVHEYGCAHLEEGSDASHLRCKSYLVPHSQPYSIACCYEGNFCNLNITPPPYTGHSDWGYEEGGPLRPPPPSILVIVASSLGAVALVVAVGLFMLIRWRRGIKEKGGSDEEKALVVDSSGSGSCGAVLNQRTIAQDLTILSVIGRGRYGEVRLAQYRGSYVAVKTFYTTDEESWKNEKDIYHTVMFNHDNVLQFVAADICSEDSTTHMLLVAAYHELGSLCEYLRQLQSVTIDEGLLLAHSIICGLEHLHSAVHGTGGMRKPEIAHRDLKSKNIIVKRPGVCCIADFGLAVRMEDKMIPEKPKIQVGTKRYMAPEVLSKSLNPQLMSHFKMADIYAVALVIWEIVTKMELHPADPSSPLPTRSCEQSQESGLGESISNDTTPKAQHHPKRSADMSGRSSTPYELLVATDPSLEEMRAVVCVGKRPPIDQSFRSTQHMGIPTVVNLIEESWQNNPEARLTALKLKFSLKNVIDERQRVYFLPPPVIDELTATTTTAQ